jgi:uncharacterized protein YbcC (UPF0753/DUF2309 family)
MTTLSPALAAADAATRTVAPLWPLRHFVAVNPFLGMTGKTFAEAAAEMAALAGARTTAPRSLIAEAIAAGRITDADLAAGAAAAGLPGTPPAALKRAASTEAPALAPLPTLADLAAGQWPALVTDRISAFAAQWFDEGQALWSAAPGASLYTAWKVEAEADATPEIAGLAAVRSTFAKLPATPEVLFAHAQSTLGLTDAAFARYLARLVMSLPGWSGFARYKLWQAELHKGTTTEATDLLAVRLAWDLALLPLAKGWESAKAAYTAAPQADLDIDVALQSAYEAAWHREMIARFTGTAAAGTDRPPFQAAFCIDVRSEVFRRALESVEPQAETIGFAGFFGASVDYRPLAHDHATARCPVLLTPGYTVPETAPQGTALSRAARLRSGAAWTGFGKAAVASFGYVETLGLAAAAKLGLAAMGLKAPAADPRNAGLTEAEAQSLAPDLAAIPEADRPGMAAFMLKGMTLTGPLARIVLLAGHGATSANNPHATGLDCGACGGHTGEANARIACAILNDPKVRAALPGLGLDVPADTIFVPALHNTTTDEVTLFDTAPFAATHGADLARLKQAIAEAGRLCRTERAVLLGNPTQSAIPARATDWSQVRPEWGLAGCAAFVAAPRSRTAGVDLKGRAFLHSYEWQADDGFGILELIMTAPLVVASWINLQYYGSTVDNRAFGSGNKVLHNTVGLLGVYEGTGGDLRSGLPLQSIHDGERFIHEPLRLNAVIEAPEAAMSAIIAKNEGLRQLVDNGWVHLWRMDEQGRIAARYTGNGKWQPIAPQELPAAA